MNSVLQTTQLVNIRLLFLRVLCCCLFVSCSENEKNLPGSELHYGDSSSPALTPEESMKTMKLEKGFSIELVAAEPLVNSPVAMIFDHLNRIWVVEMQSYMPDTLGTGEDERSGKIVILDDTDKDGRMDTRTVFLDSLVLPRAICLVDDGILVAEPPSLYFFKIENDRPVKKILVDSLYAAGGNVEHQPNGLYRGFDNWIYSAEGGKKYKKEGNNWIIERMYRRGQWGLSQDDFGRLFYNNNSANLLGDYFSPGIKSNNDNQGTPSGFNERIVQNNKVYPLGPTPGVNRGYTEKTLDSSKKLVNFTAASGPVIYRGDLFGKDYYGNAFVGEPSANLVKRNILSHDGYIKKGEQAYQGREFLASTDERFRPVTLYNGPDGALYVVDFYRGIIQHKTYITPYLKNEIRKRELTNPLNMGRIYKIIPENSSPEPVLFPSDNKQLAKLLTHTNGWVRDKTMQLLLDRKAVDAVSSIREILKNNSANPAITAAAIWTLNGLDSLSVDQLIDLLNKEDPYMRIQALQVLPSYIDAKNLARFKPVLSSMLSRTDTISYPFIAYLCNQIRSFDKSFSKALLDQLISKSPNNEYVADAIISNFENREMAFRQQLANIHSDTSLLIHRQLKNVLRRIENRKMAANSEQVKKQFPRGAEVYKTICQTCHGADGNGVSSLAPPLNNSEWVTGNKNRLISIILYGLSGPITVKGKLYAPPEISSEMPGLAGNNTLTNDDLAQVMSFIRKSWGNKSSVISSEEVGSIRKKNNGREQAFTAEELKSIQ